MSKSFLEQTIPAFATRFFAPRLFTPCKKSSNKPLNPGCNFGHDRFFQKQKNNYLKPLIIEAFKILDSALKSPKNMKLKNYICGQWIAGVGDEIPLYNAVNGDLVAISDTSGIDFQETLEYHCFQTKHIECILNNKLDKNNKLIYFFSKCFN